MKTMLLFLMLMASGFSKLFPPNKEACNFLKREITDTIKGHASILNQTGKLHLYSREGRYVAAMVCKSKIKGSAACYEGSTGPSYVTTLDPVEHHHYLTVYAYESLYSIRYEEDDKGHYHYYKFDCKNGMARQNLKLERGHCDIKFTDRGVELNANYKMPYEITTTGKLYQGFLIHDETFSIDNDKTPVHVLCGNSANYTVAVRTNNMNCVAWLLFFKIPTFIAKNMCMMPITFSMVFYFAGSFFFITLLSWLGALWLLFPVVSPLLFIFILIAKRFIPTCKTCGSMIHIAHCSMKCECGAHFESSEMKKRHKLAGACKHKVIIMYKRLINRKGSTLVLAIICLIIITTIPGAMGETHEKVHPAVVPQVYDALFTGSFEDSDMIKHPEVTVELPISENAAFKIEMKAKTSGLHIGDGIFRVLKSGYQATYESKYLVGPTTDYHFEHDEKCTGICPDYGKFQFNSSSWNKFRISDTSHWGCEEFGCMAIAEGCVWGQCQDMIETRGRVFEKVEEVDKIDVKFCYQFTDEYQCVAMTDHTYKSTQVDAILEYQDVKVLPNPILCNRTFECYQGDICTSGSYDKKCGNLKLVEGVGVLGTGSPKVELKCHAASRKDVTLDKCFDNSYHLCEGLKRLNPTNFEVTPINGATIKIRDHSRVGTLKLTLRLPDIQLKELSLDSNIKSFKGTCEGCINCYKQLQCDVDIVASDDTSCEVQSNDISLVYTRLFISNGVHRYHVTGIITKNVKSIVLKICSKEVELPTKVLDGKDTIEYLGHDHYLSKEVYQEDCRSITCKTTFEWNAFLPSLVPSFVYDYIKLGVVLILGLVLLRYVGVPGTRALLRMLMQIKAEYNADSPVLISRRKILKKV